MKPRQRGHDRGLVLVNLAAVMDGGATSLSDRELFIRQPDVLGSGASVPTTWRTLHALDDAVAVRLATARAASHASCKI